MATTQLTTNNYKLHNANQFIESFNEPANTVYYMFAGIASAYGGGVVPQAYDSVKTVQFNTYNSMLFAKHIISDDVKLMVNANLWTAGTVYPYYDDNDPNLATKPFYVYTYEGSIYYVFKCLNNNDGAASTYKPTFADTAPDDVYYETSDGYHWKYMYQVDSATFNKFNNSFYMPVVPDENVSGNAVPGAVDVILVRTGGSGYTNHFVGKFGSSGNFKTIGNAPLVELANVVYANSTTRIYASPNNAITPSAVSGVYNGCYLYITGGTGAGQWRTITSHVSNSLGIYAYLDSKFIPTPDSTSHFEINPRVVILNSGDEAVTTEARALVSPSAANSIYKVEILNRGSGISSAGAYVYSAPQAGVSNAATLKVISGPKGGHGANVANELFCSRVGISLTFDGSEGDTIPDSSTYRSAGIIRDPLFSNLVFAVDYQTSPFLANEEVTQSIYHEDTGITTTAKGIVVSSSLGSLQVTNASGFFVTTTNSTVGTIVGTTSSSNAFITEIEVSGLVKNFETFTEYYRYDGSLLSGTFIQGEKVYQSNVAVSNAIFYANNSYGNSIYISEKLGPIYPTSLVSGPLIGVTSGARFDINTIHAPDVIIESGDVIYIENFDPVTRAPGQKETIKLILEY
jgi:hypothetical protein